VNVASTERSDSEAHVGTDVQGHIAKRSIESVRYEVSEKHLGTNLHINCAAVSLSNIVIIPPHFRQAQDDTAGAISVDRMTGAIFNRWRQKSSDTDRW